MQERVEWSDLACPASLEMEKYQETLGTDLHWKASWLGGVGIWPLCSWGSKQGGERRILSGSLSLDSFTRSSVGWVVLQRVIPGVSSGPLLRGP